MDASDIAAVATPLGNEDREVYRQLRDAMMLGPIDAARILPRLLLSNPDAGEEGVRYPFDYQEAAVGHILFQTWDYVDILLPTGMGKTHGIGMAEALRMFFETETAAIIAPIEKQTKYIADKVREFYLTGHPMLRAAFDEDSPKDELRVRRPNGQISTLFCRTANQNNEGDSLLGLQGLTTILLDERSILPDKIFLEKVDRITAPQGRRRLMAGITTTQELNHVHDWVEAPKLPRREKCDSLVPHLTKIGGAVFKSTWRDGVKAGRYTQEFIERRYNQLGPEKFAQWYECEFPAAGGDQIFPPELLRSMTAQWTSRNGVYRQPEGLW